MAWIPNNPKGLEPINGVEASNPDLALSARRSATDRETRLHELKNRVHRRLVERLNVAQLETLEASRMAEEIRRAVLMLLEEEPIPLNLEERASLVQELEFEVLGLGPLETLMRDPTISDILVNRSDLIYIERAGRLERTEVRFRDNAHLMRIINKIVSNVGRRIDESSPMVDARLQDGSRINAIIPPLALDGPMLSIRRFAVQRPSLEDLISKGSVTPEIGEVLKAIVKARLSILISGGTGAGKTTLLNILSGFIPATERIITIEDSAELQLQQEHVCRLETRPANVEGKGEITARDLVRNSLRMRPDRIVVGEVRGAEVMDMLQAMNTGHEGSMTTVHANSPREALIRLETMISLSGFNIMEKAMRQLISSSLNVIIQAARQSDGTRRVTALAEVTGMESGVISLQDIFVFERQGVDDSGRVLGQFKATGVRPRFADRCKIFGVPIPDAIFAPQPTSDGLWGKPSKRW
ncbi:MAG: CpaF family protein [Desulfobacca sp.]|nr:CpaF family protein [Desulfobacca sp.]